MKYNKNTVNQKGRKSKLLSAHYGDYLIIFLITYVVGIVMPILHIDKEPQGG